MNPFIRLSKTLLLSAALGAIAATNTWVLADEVAIPVGQQGADKTSLEKPKTGMKAEAVEKKFGAPLMKSAAVGKPPISHWEYPHFYVYFESDRVINTVLKPYSETIATPTTEPTAPVPVTAPVPEPTPAPVAASTPEPTATTEAPPMPVTIVTPQVAAPKDPVTTSAEPMPATEAPKAADNAAPAVETQNESDAKSTGDLVK